MSNRNNGKLGYRIMKILKKINKYLTIDLIVGILVLVIIVVGVLTVIGMGVKDV